MMTDKIPVYMAVSPDKYELPMAVEDTIRSLSLLLGVTESAICKGVKRHDKGLPSRYMRVWIDLTPEEAAERARRVSIARQLAHMT